MTRTPAVVASSLLATLASVGDALAYKVTTHQVVAVRAVERLPEGDLKSNLRANEVYLRSGAMGPDLFLLPGSGGYPSDLAHYCKTGELAKNFLALSEGRSPRAQAFAYGWFSHNITDSVAHPWVNGFTGQPYSPAGASQEGFVNFGLNMTHIGIETWVDKQVFTQQGTSIARRYAQAKGLVSAFDPLIKDDEIQQLFIDAYRATYSGGDCIGKKRDRPAARLQCARHGARRPPPGPCRGAWPAARLGLRRRSPLPFPKQVGSLRRSVCEPMR